MRIRQWHIDGFGVFCDYRVSNLGKGLTVFVGPNEAGKSTLLAFLRGVLFGYAGKGKPGRGEPLAGGRHGGKLVLDCEAAGRVEVSRYGDKKNALAVAFADGRTGGEAELSALLGQADRQLFQQVFAFSLTELQFESLKDPAVRDKVFHAGIAGAGRSAGQVVARLEEPLRELYAGPRARSRARTLMTELAELEARLADARAQADQYADLVRRQDEARARVAELDARQRRLRSRIDHLALLEELWPTYARHEQAAGRLKELEPIDDFPPQAQQRLAECLSELRAAEESAQSARAACGANRAEAAALSPLLRDDVRAVAAATAAQAQALPLHRRHLEEYVQVQERIAQASRAVEDAVRSLGPAWQAHDVEGFDTSLPREEAVRQWKDKLSAAQASAGSALSAAQAAVRRSAEAAAEHERLSQRLAGLPAVDGAALADREARLIELRSLVARCDALQTQSEAQARLLDEPLPAPAARAGRSWPHIAVLLAVSAVALALGLWRLSGDDIISFAFLFALGVMGGLAAWMLIRSGGSTVTAAQSGLLPALHNQIQQAWRQLDQLRAQLEQHALALGLSMPVAPDQLAAAERSLRQQRDAIASCGSLREQIESAGQALRERRHDAEHARQSADAASAALEQVQRDFAQWKRQAAIPETLTPEGVLAFLPRVDSAREKLRALSAARAEQDRLAREIAAWQERSRGLLARASLAPDPAGGPGAAIDALEQLAALCAQDAARRDELDRLDRQALELETRSRLADQRRQQARQALLALLEQASARDEADFRRRYQVHLDRRQILQELDALTASLSGRLGRGRQADQVRAELPAGRLDEWMQQRLAAQAELDQAEKEYVAAVQAERDADTRRRAVEESADVPSLELAIAGKRGELAGLLEQWRVLKLAQALVQTTLTRFVRERQPGVLAQAASMFRRVTLGRYDRLELDSDAQGLTIVGANLDRKTPEQLSRGAAEQLYLCLRLALASEFASRQAASGTTGVPPVEAAAGDAAGEKPAPRKPTQARPAPLPLIMDDVLVNFDPARARSMAEVLLEFARSHQVLLFTCHPQTADLLLSLQPELRVEHIPVRAG